MSEKRHTNRRSAPPPSRAEATPLPRKPRPRPSPFTRGAVVADRYKIRARIGAGGMGVVYGALDIQTGEEVALKALAGDSVTAQNLRRFRREAETAASVKHRHVCAVSYLGVEQGAPFIVMERLEGETLQRRLKETGPLAATDTVTVMIQMLDGLSAAHARGVLHRDIKPSNIFITTPRGAAPSIKIIDFGLAKLLPTVLWQPRPGAPPEELSAITTTDVIPGTPFYLAPEQVAGRRDLDERVDVWAAGLTFFEMLSGRRAYDATSYAALAARIVLSSLPPVRATRSDVPATFDDVLRKALAKDRSSRFSSAATFRAALVESWARFRTEGLARGERLLKPRRTPATPARDEVGADDATEIDVEVLFDPNG